MNEKYSQTSWRKQPDKPEQKPELDDLKEEDCTCSVNSKLANELTSQLANESLKDIVRIVHDFSLKHIEKYYQ